MTDRIKLKVLGVSYINKSGDNIPYIVILGKENDMLQVPIIIGASEAQSIAIAIDNIPAPRPLSHDIFVAITKEFDITVKELIIYEYNEGIFFAKLICENNDKIKEIECRPSDGIAIALRLNVPIYTTTEIYKETCINIGERKYSQNKSLVTENSDDEENKPIEELNINQLRKRLSKAIKEENYELAATINNRLKNLSQNL